jgi:hypothetical protein
MMMNVIITILIRLYLKKIGRYKLEIILIVLQLCGPYVGVLGLILASFYSFYIISFKARIDILQIFLLDGVGCHWQLFQQFC